MAGRTRAGPPAFSGDFWNIIASRCFHDGRANFTLNHTRLAMGVHKSDIYFGGRPATRFRAIMGDRVVEVDLHPDAYLFPVSFIWRPFEAIMSLRFDVID